MKKVIKGIIVAVVVVLLLGGGVVLAKSFDLPTKFLTVMEIQVKPDPDLTIPSIEIVLSDDDITEVVGIQGELVNSGDRQLTCFLHCQLNDSSSRGCEKWGVSANSNVKFFVPTRPDFELAELQTIKLIINRCDN